MRFDSLERLIEKLFAENPEESTPADAEKAAAVAAALGRNGDAFRSSTGDPSEPLAAWLDGALDGEARCVFEEGLAHSPGEREDLEAARAFLDAVSEHIDAAPPELVEAMVAGLVNEQAQASERRLWQRIFAWVWARPRAAGVLGGTMAVAFSIVLMVSANLDRATAPFKEVAPPVAHAAKSRHSVVSAPEPISLPKPDTVIAPQASPAPIAPHASPAPPVANDAASSLKQLQNEEMYELGAKRDAAEEAGAAYDPCAHRHTRHKGTATAAEADKTSSKGENPGCDKDFADHGIASQPGFSSAPAAADAMPAETAPDATGSAMPSSQPDAPPH